LHATQSQLPEQLHTHWPTHNTAWSFHMWYPSRRTRGRKHVAPPSGNKPFTEVPKGRRGASALSPPAGPKSNFILPQHGQYYRGRGRVGNATELTDVDAPLLWPAKLLVAGGRWEAFPKCRRPRSPRDGTLVPRCTESGYCRRPPPHFTFTFTCSHNTTLRETLPSSRHDTIFFSSPNIFHIIFFTLFNIYALHHGLGAGGLRDIFASTHHSGLWC